MSHAGRRGHRHPREHGLRRVRGDARRAPPLPGRGRRRGPAEPERPRLLPPPRRGAGADRRGRAARARRDPAPRGRRDDERLPASATSSRSRSTRPSRRRCSTTTRTPTRPTGSPRGGRALRGRSADDDARRHPRRARARADAARGDDVRPRDPRGHGLADLLDDDAARRRRARVVPAARRPPGPRRQRTCTCRSRATSASSCSTSSRRSSRSTPAARRSCSPRSLARVRRGRLEPRAQDRRPHRRERARPARGDGGAGVPRRAEPHGPDRRLRDRGRARRGRHAQAASAIVREGSTPSATRVVEELGGPPRSRARARRHVAAAPRGRPDDSVRDAMTLCQRHGQSGVFVAEDGRVVGSVSREDLDKALGHGLAHAPVRGIMSGRVDRGRRGRDARPSCSRSSPPRTTAGSRCSATRSSSGS